ncbi:hypothetical protein CLCR_11345 [Cladophialophora carrionii]|uniref:Uncharacterized protein n=1 Tax=Cladophialophora carrionii TaxID=86049 RepID=A0A1C1CQK3_9EURO|nr:hypothetical protein CLCR_11345 [Cladophialophora carrionii]
MLALGASLAATFLAGLATGTGVGAPLLKRSNQPGIAGNAAWDGSTYRCPEGSNIFLEKWCCPEGYEYDTNSGQFTSFICCPIGGPECSQQVLDCPICADSNWVYFDIGGTNVPPTLPFCCEQGYAPAGLPEPQPANVCTSGANLWTDYATASQCGQVADATGSPSPGTTSATATDSGGQSASATSAETTATADATTGGSSESGADSSLSFSAHLLLMTMLLPGILMVVM